MPIVVLGFLFVVGGVIDYFPTPTPIETLTPLPEQSPIDEGPIQKKTLGYSAKERPIDVYQIGTGENTLLLFGAIHGNEMGTADLMNKLLAELTANPTLISPTKKIIIIPISNPDGYYDRTDKLNAREVNLNLNFPTTDWKQYGGEEGHFAGTEPFSETESNVIKQVVEEYKPYAMIAYHSQGGLVSPEAKEGSINLAKWYGRKTNYDYFDEWDYAGTATRWFEETTGNPAITVELTDHMKNDWEINREALLELVSSDLSELK